MQTRVPCEFLLDETKEARCGRSPTDLFAVGTTAPFPKRQGPVCGLARKLRYGHFCDEHLPEMQRRLQRTT